MSRHNYNQVIDAKRGKKPNRESDDPNCSQLQQPEYDGLPETLEQDLPAIISAAEKTMTPREKEVWNIIIENHRNGGERLSQKEISQKLSMAQCNVSINIKAIGRKIREAAYAIGSDECGALIDGLMRMHENKKSR